jgi:hypothetical protein
MPIIGDTDPFRMAGRGGEPFVGFPHEAHGTKDT